MPTSSWIFLDFKTESSIISSIPKNENSSINSKPAGYSPPAEKTHDCPMVDNGESTTGDYFNQQNFQKSVLKKEHHKKRAQVSIKQSLKIFGTDDTPMLSARHLFPPTNSLLFFTYKHNFYMKTSSPLK